MEEKVMDMTMINRDKFTEYVLDTLEEEVPEAVSMADDSGFALLVVGISMSFAKKLEKRIFGDDSTD